jgi:hypothetical protein
MTLLNLTLATDFNPRATFGASQFSLDLRPYLSAAQLGNLTWDRIITCAGAASVQVHHLGPFRKAVATYSARPEVGQVSLFRRTVWEMAREYKEKMKNDVNGSIRDWMACNLVGSDIEDFITSSLPRIGHLISDTYLVSNLGAFSSHQKDVVAKGGTKPDWTIEDMQFSAAATNGNVGSRGVTFNVAGIAGGDTIINASYEEGIMHRETVKEILDRAIEKLDWLLN